MADVSSTTGVTDGSAAAFGFGSAAGPSRDQFLKLLVLQLQNQDPLNPITDQNFTAQLAEFSSLEQLTQINQNLLGLGGIQQDLVNSQALNLLGKNILVSSDTPLHVAGGRADEILVDAPASAASVNVQVKNAAGGIVRTLEVPPGAGRRPVSWDGTDDQGHPLADGEYTVAVVAKDAQGADVSASVFLSLTIDGISFTADGVRLGSGGRSLTFDQILEIRTS